MTVWRAAAPIWRACSGWSRRWRMALAIAASVLSTSRPFLPWRMSSLRPADMACDHGHRRRHGQQDAGAKALAGGDIDEDFRGGDLLFEVGDHLHAHAGEECGILFQAEHQIGRASC